MNILINQNLKTKEDVYELISKFSDDCFIYTDGTKDYGNVSLAIYDKSHKTGIGYKIHKDASIFTAEAAAVLTALRHIQIHNRGILNWVIASESMSVLKALQNNKLDANTNYLIHAIKDLWHLLSNNNIVVAFVWVPAHKGVLGNENADFLAKLTCTNRSVPYNNNLVALPFSDIDCLLKQRMCEKWTQHYNHCTQIQNKGLDYACLNVGINQMPWFCRDNVFHKRKFYSIICRLRFTHCRLNYHLHCMNMVDSPICQYCCLDKDQSLIAHFL